MGSLRSRTQPVYLVGLADSRNIGYRINITALGARADFLRCTRELHVVSRRVQLGDILHLAVRHPIGNHGTRVDSKKKYAWSVQRVGFPIMLAWLPTTTVFMASVRASVAANARMENTWPLMELVSFVVRAHNVPQGNLAPKYHRFCRRIDIARTAHVENMPHPNRPIIAVHAQIANHLL